MKATIPYILFILAIAGCNNKTTTHETAVAAAIIQKPIDTAAFLALFPIIKSDTVFLTTEDSALRASEFLTGKLIDRAYVGLFSKFSTEGKHYSYFETNEESTGAYAIGKFDIGEYTALIVRHPGMYSSTCITVFFYDKQKRELHDSHYWIAESWGDAGDYLAFNSILRQIRDSVYIVEIYKYENGPDESDTSGYKYINLDSTLVYKLENTELDFIAATENKRWTDEPMKPEEESKND
ncbi:MAG TPA: hypothetical protein VK174_12690 [Chitinophagales bacterium]|nr:hypothetical protein [Chitinophagales bacterium]